jgi:pilus assembly protein CpaB
VLRKPGEPSNPVVETVSMNDLRYNMYGGARYPAPAAVGAFGNLASAVGGAMNRTSETIAARPRPHRATSSKAKAKAPADTSKQIEIYRGTKSDQIKVGG